MNEFNRRDALAGGRLLPAATSLGFGRADAARARVPPGTGRLKAIDATMRKAVDAGTVAGVVAIGATRRGTVYEDSYGKANVATGSPMTPDSVFWRPSMTKAFTATLPFMATSSATSAPASAGRE
jgi:methyl acetate hydrolase